MITAKEAREIKLTVVSDEQEINDTLQRVNKSIIRMAEMGFTNTVFEIKKNGQYKIIHDKLIELGYKVGIIDSELMQIFW